MSWYNPASWFVDSEAVKAGQDADAKIAQINAQQLSNGMLTQDEYDQAQKHLREDSINQAQAEQQVTEAALEGLSDGAKAEVNLVTKAVPNAINATLNETLKAIFRAIPWWLWLVGIGVLVYMFLGQRFIVKLKGR